MRGRLLYLLHCFSTYHHPHNRQVVGSNPLPAGQISDGVQHTGGCNVPHGCGGVARLQFPESGETTKLWKLSLEQAGCCDLHDLHQSDRLHCGYRLLSASGVLRFTCLENLRGSSFLGCEMYSLLKVLLHQLV